MHPNLLNDIPNKLTDILNPNKFKNCVLKPWAGPTKALFTRQQIRSVSQFIQVSLNSSYLKSHRIQNVYTADMPKKIKLQLRFLLLEIYPDSPVYTSTNTESIKFVQLCCEFTRVNAFTLWHKRIETYLAKYLSTFFSGLVFLRIDPHRMLFLRIASKRIKLIRTNIFIRFCNLPR